MKTKLYSLFLLSGLILINMNSYAKCWRVNNNTNPGQGITADFTQLQDAINSTNVHDGDTVYIEPSTSNYNDFYCNKSLVIIGPGYFLDQNPETQVHNWVANFNNNSPGTSTTSFEHGSEGSKIMGISFLLNNNCNGEGCRTDNFYINTNNITVQRCYFSGNNSTIFLRGATINNTIITENFISGNILCDQGNGAIVIKNNIITGYISINNTHNGTILNNVISGNLNVNNCSILNNIMTNSGATFVDIISSCTYSYNIGAGGQFGTDNYNQSIADMSSVFVCWGTCSGYSPDSMYILKTGSPASGTGAGGIDMGAFGGPNPYILSGLPNVPAIYKYDFWNSPNHVNIHIKAKAHN